jgi:hypothetical protein
MVQLQEDKKKMQEELKEVSKIFFVCDKPLWTNSTLAVANPRGQEHGLSGCPQ